jgi:NADH:ubiquinone oxidoreductase subunit E
MLRALAQMLEKFGAFLAQTEQDSRQAASKARREHMLRVAKAYNEERRKPAGERDEQRLRKLRIEKLQLFIAFYKASG